MTLTLGDQPNLRDPLEKKYFSIKKSEFTGEGAFATRVLYMSFSFWLLGVESHDFYHSEKKGTACKAEQIHKITTRYFHPKWS
jgi:hypothetical protein